jgi:polyphosphate kinase
VLDIQFSDNVKARKLLPNGEYKVDRNHDMNDIRSQYALYEYYKTKE